MPVVKEKVEKGGKLSVFDVSQIIVEKGIRTPLQLLAYTNNQKREGKTDLVELRANRGARRLMRPSV